MSGTTRTTEKFLSDGEVRGDVTEQGSPAISVEALRSHDPRINRQAWNDAYPWLLSAGMALARRLLAGNSWESAREDLVSTALSQVVEGLIEGNSEFFNQITSFNDLIGMTRTIVRRRVVDLHRARARSLEDAVEHLPEPAADSGGLPFSWTDLDEYLAKLGPPKPDLFRDRFYLGLTTRDIADRRKLPHGSVCQHFADGLRLLRDWIEAEYTPSPSYRAP